MVLQQRVLGVRSSGRGDEKSVLRTIGSRSEGLRTPSQASPPRPDRGPARRDWYSATMNLPARTFILHCGRWNPHRGWVTAIGTAMRAPSMSISRDGIERFGVALAYVVLDCAPWPFFFPRARENAFVSQLSSRVADFSCKRRSPVYRYRSPPDFFIY